MRKFFIPLLIIVVAFIGCGKDQTRLEKGTPVYDFAKQISGKISFFDPDSNNILVHTRYFNVTTGEILNNIYANSGKGAIRFVNLDSTQLIQILRNNGQNFTEMKLLLRAAEGKKVRLSPTEQDSLLKEQYMRYGGRENFVKSLQRNGIDSVWVDGQMKKSMLIEKYLNEIIKEQSKISDDSLMAIYGNDKSATVRHILLTTQGKSESAKAEIHKKMEKILARARKGENFEKLVKEFSEDPGSRDKGGLYENFPRGMMVKPFEEAAFTVPVGQISDIVETSYGYHIMKVEARTRENRPFEEVKEEIRAQLEQSRRPEISQRHVDQLRSEAEYRMVEF